VFVASPLDLVRVLDLTIAAEKERASLHRGQKGEGWVSWTPVVWETAGRLGLKKN